MRAEYHDLVRLFGSANFSNRVVNLHGLVSD